MAALNVFWNNAGFRAIEGLAVSKEEGLKVLRQMDDDGVTFLSFTGGTGKQHRIRKDEIRRVRLDDA
jgi:hypothetical protein